MREYINSVENPFNEISNFPNVNVGKLLNKFFFYQCENCKQIKEKRIYSENRKLKVDFICRECKVKTTSKERFGVENPAQAESVKAKSKQVCLQKYGVDNAAKASEFKEKIRNNHAGDFETREKYKQTCLKKYGVDNAAKSEIIKEKTAKTNLERYGCKAPAQNPRILKKCFKNIYYDSIYFDSSWEVVYYIWCKNHNIDIKRNTELFGLSNGTKCNPDFIVDGQLVEIKGDHLKKQESYKYKQEFYKKNNVKVLSYDDLLPIFKEVYSEMKEKNLPLPKIESKRDIFLVSDISEIEQYKHKNCKIQYVCTECGKMNITGYKVLKHFNNLLCKSCRKTISTN